MGDKKDYDEPIEPLDIKKFLPLETHQAIPEKERVPEKKSILLIVIFSIITLGIYYSIWYIRRSPEFNNLGTKKKLSKKLGVIYLIVKIGLILTAIILPSTIDTQVMGDFYQNPTDQQVYMFFTFMILAMLDLFFSLLLAFYSRSVMNEALGNKGMTKKISWLFTLILNIFYLQYETNRIIDDEEEKPRRGPWIALGAIVVFILLIVLISI